MFDPITLVAALGPLLVEGGKAAIQRWVASDTIKPVTVEDYKAIKQVDLDWFNAINNAGGNNASYPWVEAVVRLQRPGIALAVVGTWAFCHLFQVQCGSEVDNFAAAIGFYLFGDRSLFYAKKK